MAEVECIGYTGREIVWDIGEPIYVEIEEEAHPMFMGVVDGEEIWTKVS